MTRQEKITGYGLKGNDLEKELQKSEQELGLNNSEQVKVKKETPLEEKNYTGKPKDEEKIALDDKIKNERISEIKNQIKQKIDEVKENSIAPESKMEQIGKIESTIKNRLNDLIESANNKEDKKVFTEILEKINKIKNNLKEEKRIFEETQHKYGSIKNLQKFYKSNNGLNRLKDSASRGLSLDIPNGFDNKDAYLTGTTIVDLNKTTPDQTRKILYALDFYEINKLAGSNFKKDIIFKAYNEKKPFYKSKAIPGDGKHKFNINSEIPGVVLKAYSSKTYGDSVHVSLGKEFVDEILGGDLD